VNDLDLRIFRWMYPGGVWSWWGTDPRISTSEIASHVGVERKTVWARIRRWRSDGFWEGFEVRPNPRIFGAGQVHVEIPVEGPAQGAALIDELEHVDGVLWAHVAYGISAAGHEGEVVWVALASEDARRVNRRIRMLRRLSPTGGVDGPYRDATPPCSHSLTALDWRIIACVIPNPNASPVRLARLLGVTLKTFAQHQATLIERHAIFYLPNVDWTKVGGVLLALYCRTAGDVDRVRAELEARYPASIPMTFDWCEGISPEWENSSSFAAMVPSHSPHEVHALVRDTSRIPGVKLVRPETWGPQRLYLDWVNRLTAEHVAATMAPVPGHAPRLGVPGRNGRATVTPVESRGVTAP